MTESTTLTVAMPEVSCEIELPLAEWSRIPSAKRAYDAVQKALREACGGECKGMAPERR